MQRSPSRLTDPHLQAVHDHDHHRRYRHRYFSTHSSEVPCKGQAKRQGSARVTSADVAVQASKQARRALRGASIGTRAWAGVASLGVRSVRRAATPERSTRQVAQSLQPWSNHAATGQLGTARI